VYKYLLSGLVFIALLVGATGAAAVCSSGTYYQVFVGDKVNHSSCTYNSIQDALNATYLCAYTIRVTREHTYTSQHLTLNGTTKPLTLQGEADGVTCDQLAHCPSTDLTHCHAPTTQPLVTIDGSNTAGSVLTITGNSTLTLRDLTITRGSADASAGGGGIQFDGTGSLALDTTTVSLNYAGYGGGINVYGNGGAATLTLDANSLVINNVAEHDGGGIRLTGQARLLDLQPQTLIAYNQANGYGGGIEIVGPARADIGSPGLNGVAAVYFNSAQSGGGVAVIDNGSGEAVLREFATSDSQPTAISDNTASSNGGGIFLAGQADACLFAPYLVSNIAEDGAAIYYSPQVGDSDKSDSGVYINGGSPSRLGPDCGPETVASLGGSKVCRPYDANCSAFVNSTTQHANGTPAPGAAISLVKGNYAESGNLIATRFRLRNSIAGYAINISSGTATVDRCLITDNGVSTYLVSAYSFSVAEFHNCTIANNIIDGGVVFWSGYYPSRLDLANDIIYQPGSSAATWDPSGSGAFAAAYILTDSLAGLPGSNPSIVTGAPTFVDEGNGDYHLERIAQKALDFGHTGALDNDLDGSPPSVDLPSIPNTFDPADLGAYERQNLFYDCGTSDSVFCDGFDH